MVLAELLRLNTNKVVELISYDKMDLVQQE